METKDKKSVHFNLTKKLLSRLDKMTREQLPNKSILVEKLLWRWINEKENVDTKVPEL